MKDETAKALARFLNPRNSLDRILHDDNPIVVAAQWAASFPTDEDVETLMALLHPIYGLQEADLRAALEAVKEGGA